MWARRGRGCAEEMLTAARRVIDAARSAGAEFVVVCRDTFEDNGVDRVLVQKVADILGEFGGPVYVIPGNHDPFMPGSVREHPDVAVERRHNAFSAVDARVA